MINKARTIVRNGIFIVYPESQEKDIKRDQKAFVKQSKIKQSRDVAKLKKHRSVLINKKCIRCEDTEWISGKLYCWDCYKHERYESK